MIPYNTVYTVIDPDILIRSVSLPISVYRFWTEKPKIFSSPIIYTQQQWEIRKLQLAQFFSLSLFSAYSRENAESLEKKLYIHTHNEHRIARLIDGTWWWRRRNSVLAEPVVRSRARERMQGPTRWDDFFLYIIYRRRRRRWDLISRYTCVPTRYLFAGSRDWQKHVFASYNIPIYIYIWVWKKLIWPDTFLLLNLYCCVEEKCEIGN